MLSVGPMVPQLVILMELPFQAHWQEVVHGKDLLQTLRDMAPMGMCDSAEQYPRWLLLWQIQAVIQVI